MTLCPSNCRHSLLLSSVPQVSQRFKILHHCHSPMLPSHGDFNIHIIHTILFPILLKDSLILVFPPHTSNLSIIPTPLSAENLVSYFQKKPKTPESEENFHNSQHPGSVSRHCPFLLSFYYRWTEYAPSAGEIFHLLTYLTSLLQKFDPLLHQNFSLLLHLYLQFTNMLFLSFK